MLTKVIYTIDILGDSQKSYLSARVASSSSKRAASAGGDSIVTQPPLSSNEDLKVVTGSQEGLDNHSIKSQSPSENPTEGGTIQNQIDSPEPTKEEEKESEGDDSVEITKDGDDTGNTEKEGKYNVGV